MDGTGRSDVPTMRDERTLDPYEATVMLKEATKQALRAFSYTSPLIALMRAAVMLFGYGAVWQSVRGQHPYRGPTSAALICIFGAVIVNAVVSTAVIRHAASGISGPSRSQQGALGAAYAVAWIATAVFQGALSHDGVSNAVAFGIFPAAAPLLVVGATVAGVAAARENRRMLITAIAVVAFGAGCAFAGPVAVWGLVAIGGCALFLGYAALQLWEGRRPLIDPR